MADGEIFPSSGAGDGITENSMLDSVFSMLVFTSSTLFAGEKTVLVASVEGAFREDLTTKSLMLVGRQKTTIGGSGMASLQRLDVWRMGRYLWIVLAIVEWVG